MVVRGSRRTGQMGVDDGTLRKGGEEEETVGGWED